LRKKQREGGKRSRGVMSVYCGGGGERREGRGRKRRAEPIEFSAFHNCSQAFDETTNQEKKGRRKEAFWGGSLGLKNRLVLSDAAWERMAPLMKGEKGEKGGEGGRKGAPWVIFRIRS